MTAATMPAQLSPDAPRSARIALSMLERLAYGTLRMRLPDGSTRSFGDGAPEAELSISNWTVFDEVLRRGDIGFAQAWIDGHWDSEHLDQVLGLMVANRAHLEAAIYGTWWGQLFDRIRHLFNRNTRSGSRRNISAHYDLGNDFYKLCVPQWHRSHRGRSAESQEEPGHAPGRTRFDDRVRLPPPESCAPAPSRCRPDRSQAPDNRLSARFAHR